METTQLRGAERRGAEPGGTEPRSTAPGRVEPGRTEPGSAERGSTDRGSAEPRFRVLGPVTMLPRTPTAAKLRMLLATLLLRANEVVSSQALIDELWGDEPPRTVTTTLQVYISQLRTLLAGEDADRSRRDGVLQTRPPGYRLQVGDDELDLTRFERLRDSGRRAYENGDFHDAGLWLREALALWSGPTAIAGTPHGPLLSAAAVHLEESRLAALEQRIAADLRLGRHAELAPELLTLAAEHPFREALHAHLMVALYRAERQSDALLAFRRLRAALVDELGVEPGPRMSRLHERILRSDPALIWKEPERSHGRAPVIWLPPGVHELVGREKAMAVADRLVDATGVEGGGESPGVGRSPASPTSAAFTAVNTGTDVNPAADRELGEPLVRLLAVSGRSGVGKTAFAVEVARRHAAAFPDGQLLVPLRGADGTALDADASAAAVLRRLGRRLSTADEGQAQRELGQALHGRRMLLVLDDAVREEQVHPVSAALADGLLLVTSQRALVGLENARQLTLEVLTPAEAHRMLQTLGVPQLTDEPEAAREIVRLCGRLPLALRVAAATLSARPHWTATTLVERLADRDASLDALATGDLDVRAALTVGYRESGEAERRAFRLLSLACDAGFSLWTARLLLRLAPAEAERCLERLVESRLLEVVGTGIDGEPRYGYHRLMRTLAVELLDATETAEQRGQAARRLARGYVVLARHADNLLAPGQGTAELAPGRPGDPSAGGAGAGYGARPGAGRGGERGERFGASPGDVRGRETGELYGGEGYGPGQGDARGELPGLRPGSRAGGQTNGLSGDRPGEAGGRPQAGLRPGFRPESRPGTRGGRAGTPGALPHAEPAGIRPDRFRIVGEAPARWFREETTGILQAARQAYAVGDWAPVWQLAEALSAYLEAAGRWREWSELLDLGMDAARRLRSLPAKAAVLRARGDFAWQRGRAEQASAHYAAARELYRRVDDRSGVARCLVGAGDVALGTGDWQLAESCYREALAPMPGAGQQDPRAAADVLRGLALVDLLGGRAEEALRGLQEFTEAAERLGDQRWARFGQRNAERALAHLLDWYSGQRPSQPPDMEVRPGVWLVRRTVGAGL